MLPSYLKEVLDYKSANWSYIQCAVSNTDQEFLFRGADANKKINILNECLKNVFYNLISDRITKCNNYRHPDLTDDMKTELKERSKFTKKCYKNGNKRSDLDTVVKSNECTEAISKAKDNVLSKCVRI